MAAATPEIDEDTVAHFIKTHPEGGHYAEIAEVMGVSTQRVQALLGNAMRKIRKHIAQNGMTYSDLTLDRGESIGARLESHGELR